MPHTVQIDPPAIFFDNGKGVKGGPLHRYGLVDQGDPISNHHIFPTSGGWCFVATYFQWLGGFSESPIEDKMVDSLIPIFSYQPATLWWLNVENWKITIFTGRKWSPPWWEISEIPVRVLAGAAVGFVSQLMRRNSSPWFTMVIPIE